MDKATKIGMRGASRVIGKMVPKMMDHYSSKRSLTMKVHTEGDLIAALRKKVDSSTQRQVAAEMGIHPSMLNDLVHGRRSFSDSMAKKLGFAKKIVFHRLPKD